MGSIPDDVFGIFRLLNPSVRAMTLGSNQPLTEIGNKGICWRVKAAGVKN